MRIIVGILMIFGGIAALHSGAAFLEPKDLSGEIVRVNPEKKAAVIKADDKWGEAREMKMRLINNAAFERVIHLTSLEAGTPAQVHADHRLTSGAWVASGIEVEKSKRSRGLSSVEKTELLSLEQQSAHGEISGLEYEMQKQSLQPGSKFKF